VNSILLPDGAPDHSVDRGSLDGLVTRAFLISTLGAALVVSPACVAFAQTPTGGIAGVVRDSTGARLAQARIETPNSNGGFLLRAVSDDSGRFRIGALGPGVVGLQARRIGFAPQRMHVTVVAGEIAQAEFIMRAEAVLLDGPSIEADPLRGKMGAFNRRKSRGVGAFVTRDEIEKRQPASISELLRYLPGVGVTQRMAGEPQPVHMQRSVNSSMQSTCVVQLYVDGHPYPNGSVDDFSPGSVEGVEVYRSASEIPADFRTRDATCGLISLWTRDPDAARRKP
jgi:Carboxypeptidase regulatory-like domain/TonB-dependent Receptor Plug Domain